jgi:hypothetical protein
MQAIAGSGAGVLLPARQATAARVAAAVEEAMACTGAAGAVAADFATFDSAARFRLAIDRLGDTAFTYSAARATSS